MLRIIQWKVKNSGYNGNKYRNGPVTEICTYLITTTTGIILLLKVDWKIFYQEIKEADRNGVQTQTCLKCHPIPYTEKNQMQGVIIT